MLKTNNERSRYKKYDYKTHHNTFTSRNVSQNNSDRQNSAAKSIRKMQKQTSQNSVALIQQPYYENYRIPLGKLPTNQSNPPSTHQKGKKDSQKLRAKNEQLERQAEQQKREMEHLRNELNSIKNMLGQHTNKSTKESQHLKQANESLLQKFTKQTKQMQQLQSQVRILKAVAQGAHTINSYNSEQIEESHVSRRAEYTKNYQQIMQKTSASPCEKCSRHQQQMAQVRRKYETEILKIQAQRKFLKEKVSTLHNLQQLIFDKNQCIDYLRQQVEKLQQNSNNLLTVINTLERAIAKEQQPKKLNRVNHTLRSKPDQIFTSFNDFKY